MRTAVVAHGDFGRLYHVGMSADYDVNIKRLEEIGEAFLCLIRQHAVLVAPMHAHDYGFGARFAGCFDIAAYAVAVDIVYDNVLLRLDSVRSVSVVEESDADIVDIADKRQYGVALGNGC